MSFTGILLKVEEGPRGDRGASDHPEMTYPRWRMTVQNRFGQEQSALTGRVDVVERACACIGKAIKILRGGKAGIVGGIHETPIADMVKELELSGWIRYNGNQHAWQRPDGAIFRGPALAYKILCGVNP